MNRSQYRYDIAALHREWEIQFAVLSVIASLHENDKNCHCHD